MIVDRSGKRRLVPSEVRYARFGACNLDTDNDATDHPGAIRGR